MSDNVKKIDRRKFMAISSKSHATIAGEMADDILEIIYAYSDRVPLALVIGALEIVKTEVISEHME